MATQKQPQPQPAMLDLLEAEIDCSSINWDLQENDVIDLWTLVKPISKGDREKFFPKSPLFVRTEMRDVFNELTKEDRMEVQILIGSPGVGKSVLLFLVAIHQTLNRGKPVVYVRKTRYHKELASVFFMEKVSSTGGHKIKVSYARDVNKNFVASDVATFVINLRTEFRNALSAIEEDDVILFLDGPHEGDADLNNPHHYLSTSGGFDVPQGEAAVGSTLVVLGGWRKEALRGALTAIGIPLSQGDDEVETAGQENEELKGEESIPLLTFEEVYYHTGGRIREAVSYVKNPQQWKSGRVTSIKNIAKEKVLLSLIDTNSSADEKSADRLRTMFRNSEGADFMSCVQIVDSQFYAHLLQDRAGLEQYLNAYKHAKARGLSSAAGCHFEELLHQLFHKRPKPIISVTQATGADGVSQLNVSSYWIPSTPNFANIDAAVVLNDGAMETDESPEEAAVGPTTFWCLQYTVANEHSFNSTIFRTKFLRPVCQNIGISLHDATVNVVYIIPTDVGSTFKIPEEVKDSGYSASKAMVDCSNTQTVESFLKELPFIEQPVSYAETAAEAPSVVAPPAAAKRQRQEKP